MIDTSRRLFLAGAALAGAEPGMPSIARTTPEYRLKFANIMPVDHPLNTRMVEAGKLITDKGLGFVDVDTAPFRQKLQESSFYKDWMAKLGDQAWALLEENTGKLA